MMPRMRYISRTGMSDIWSGTTSRAMTTRKSVRRSGKRIQANAYAAKAATVMGMTVDGMVTMRLLMKALAMFSVPSTAS